MKKILFSISVILFSISQVKAETVLNLALAQKINNAAFDCAAKKKINISVAIVNSEGNLILFNRGDGSYSGSIQASIDKAKSANAFRRPTSAFTKSVKEGRPELLSIKEIIAVEGGVPVNINNVHLGSIGISGGRSVEDEECAVKALEILK